MRLLLALCTLLLASFHGYRAEEEAEARLLASKNILNQYLVEGRELTVEYRIYNIGGRWVPYSPKFSDIENVPKFSDIKNVPNFFEY